MGGSTVIYGNKTVRVCTFSRTKREEFAKHRHEAKKHSSEYMSIIIDGTDHTLHQNLKLETCYRCM